MVTCQAALEYGARALIKAGHSSARCKAVLDHRARDNHNHIAHCATHLKFGWIKVGTHGNSEIKPIALRVMGKTWLMEYGNREE
ncbi:hypothetical protein HI914_03617 [Erysiphe necator]|nr:hypothetical protein HI914_03617 [Erysiphe necator]